MRREELKIINLSRPEQVDQLKELICGITGAVFVGADLESQIVEFDMFQDLNDLALTDIQCQLRDAGFEAGEVVDGSTCTLRLTQR